MSQILKLPFEFKIRHFPELPSTNSYATAQAALGAEEGMVYVTDFQTAGRGQFDRKWESAAGKNLLFSILLRPPVTPAHAPIVTQIVCHTIAHVLQQNYGLTCTLKRPNDVLVEGKKICGILTESSSRSHGRVDSVIIGVGLNVNEAPKRMKPAATSLKDLLGKKQDPGQVLSLLLGQFEKDFQELYAHPV